MHTIIYIFDFECVRGRKRCSAFVTNVLKDWAGLMMMIQEGTRTHDVCPQNSRSWEWMNKVNCRGVRRHHTHHRIECSPRKRNRSRRFGKHIGKNGQAVGKKKERHSDSKEEKLTFAVCESSARFTRNIFSSLTIDCFTSTEVSHMKLIER